MDGRAGRRRAPWPGEETATVENRSRRDALRARGQPLGSRVARLRLGRLSSRARRRRLRARDNLLWLRALGGRRCAARQSRAAGGSSLEVTQVSQEVAASSSTSSSWSGVRSLLPAADRAVERRRQRLGQGLRVQLEIHGQPVRRPLRVRDQVLRSGARGSLPGRRVLR